MMVQRRRNRRFIAAIVGLLGLVVPATASAAGVLVVHVAGTARSAPSGAVVHLLAGPDDVSTAVSGSDEYGWFATALVPTGAIAMTITATGAPASVATWALSDGGEVWLDSTGVPRGSRVEAQGYLLAHVRGTDMSGVGLTASDASGALVVTPGDAAAGEISFRVGVGATPGVVSLQETRNGTPVGVAASVDSHLFGEVWVSDVWTSARPSRAWADGSVVIHYRRADATYDGWGLHVWTGAADATTWGAPLQRSGTDAWGVVYTIPLAAGASKLSYIIHKGDTKDVPADQSLDLAASGGEVWYTQGTADGDGHAVYSVPVIRTVDADVSVAKAIWLTKGWIAWHYDGGAGTVYTLRAADPTGALISVSRGKVSGGESFPLTAASLPLSISKGAAYLDGYVGLQVPQAAIDRVGELLRDQLVVVQTDLDGTTLARASAVQLGPVLDDTYQPADQMGVSWNGDVPTIRVWAPTARSVSLVRFPDAVAAATETLPMSRDDTSGSWSITGPASWLRTYYEFSVDVFVTADQKLDTNVVTDPWSLALALNSTRSEVTDLSRPDLMPAGWQTLAKPQLKRLVDASIYELHVRDFSASDTSVPANERGTFEAFSHPASAGMMHLRQLAQAGLTHVHLLPAFDFATVNEVRSAWHTFDNLASFGSAAPDQQTAITAFANADGFNWGYDPWHYTVPEGSYAVRGEGDARSLEFRDMVAGINGAGLRVVMDVVYNHTSAAGQDPHSVLDRIVPGYYQRLMADGTIATSTCCPNTASERGMMGRLVRDSILTWAKAYKVDGFRFDLMGHMPKALLLRIRADLNGLTIAHDGVDGRSIILYGEGWNFGDDVANDRRFVQATQVNMAGTGIATFDDRLRDAVRGGGPFDANPRRQGFGSGLVTAPNGDGVNGPANVQQSTLLDLTDNVKLGLAGEMADFSFVDRGGLVTSGFQVNYNNHPGAGYTASPADQIAYVDAHDNETLYDALAFKLRRSTTMADRVRAQVLDQAIPELGQGIPFFLAGSDVLRSKSTDKNSYNSGDWFNVMDWTLQTNGFGRGLPPQGDNGSRLSWATTILQNVSLRPSRTSMIASSARFREFLRIRYSSPLFRLGSGREVSRRVTFLAPKKAAPGVIVMRIQDVGKGFANLDPKVRSIVIVFNASASAQSLTVKALAKVALVLHPVLARSADPVARRSTAKAGLLKVPALTVAVFLQR